MTTSNANHLKLDQMRPEGMWVRPEREVKVVLLVLGFQHRRRVVVVVLGNAGDRDVASHHTLVLVVNKDLLL